MATARQYSASDRLAADEETPFFLAEVIGSPAYSADFLGVVDRVRPDIFLIDWLLVSVLAAAIDLPTPCVALDHMLYDPDSWAPFFNPILGRVGASAAQLTYRGLLESLPLVLVFTYPAFSSRESFARCVEHVGPIREPVESADWPRGYPDRPFILVSLSTSFNQNQRAILQRICDALARLPVDALVTLGPNVAPEEISVRGGVELRTFVPHDPARPRYWLRPKRASSSTASTSPP